MLEFLHGKKRKVNFFWVVYGMVLVVLFLISSTDLIIKEEEAQVYPVSVIIGDASDENYVNFRKGMERAAMEFNGDISFITLYEKGNALQQKELMLREQEDGSRALIVDPVEEEMLKKMRQDNLLSVPVVCVNTKQDAMAEQHNMAVLTFDYYGMGCRMGEEILKEHPGQEKVYLLEEKESDTADRLFSKGLCEALEGKECITLLPEALCESDSAQALEELAGGRVQGAVLAASNPGSLLKTAQFFSETKGAAKWVGGLYGRGNTVPILNYLDKGIIQGLVVTDDFSAGYLSVKTAVEMSKDRPVEYMGYLKSYYIRREDLRNEKYEKMLYPVE